MVGSAAEVKGRQRWGCGVPGAIAVQTLLQEAPLARLGAVSRFDQMAGHNATTSEETGRERVNQCMIAAYGGNGWNPYPNAMGEY
ncbi:MAG: hypothetical protein HC919_00785 [Oscillatoriales cyanobacterium SM2_2_1]|nr:hypothetical protein [Oscillatoriales cyanobacterium SM2_2_1]